MDPPRKAFLAGAATVAAYLLVVIVTTPALPPVDAAVAAVSLNYVIIAGMGAGIGLQVYLSGLARQRGCRISSRRGALGGNSGGTAATSFFSFFSLVPLGCCGWWLYVLSLLPGVLGVGVSAILIEYSQALAYAGLGVVYAFAGLSAYRLRRERLAA